MKATILAVTKDLGTNTYSTFLEESKTFSGKMAGICYQKDKYFNTSVSDPEKALKRFSTVIKTGHHSIADHYYATILFEDISKMLAMILNSLNMYNTSEKSGRYTIMTGNSEKEQELYDKWKKIFHERILELYPDYDDAVLQRKLNKELENKIDNSVYKVKNGVVNESYCDTFLGNIKTNDITLPSWKLAQENARYVLSVFTRSTTMAYTTSIRQWNYIYDWACDAIKRCEEREEPFYKELSKDLIFLSDTIKNSLYIEELRDNKNRYFAFLIDLYKDINPMARYKKNNYSFSYNICYNLSFVALAQAHRHRTLRYYMMFNPNYNKNFFVPEMIISTNYADEWLKDLHSIADIYPQATLVPTIECGILPDFILKCEERLCGRAQYEIMMQTTATAYDFIEHCDTDDEIIKMYIDTLKDDTNIKTKCKLLGECKEPCYWGSKNALSRII